MARIGLIAGLVVLFASSGKSQSPTPGWTVYLRRIGPLTIGMSLESVRTELRDPNAFLIQALRQTHELPREPDDAPCAYMVTRQTPNQIGLMFDSGRLVRVDVYDPGVHTASGAQVGDTEARIRELYGARIRVEPNAYLPGGHELIYTPVDAVDRDYELLFETDGSRVTQFRIGTRRAVDQIEGCA